MTEAPGTRKEDREQLVTIMFETFQVKNMYVALDAAMSLIAHGRTTGLVIDSGKDKTYSVPVFEGFAIPQATR